MRINQKQLNDKLKNNKVLISNFSYISALQIFNLLIPLLTYPYLIRVLGNTTYGLVVFAQAIIGYLVIITDFGFNLSATKEVSVHRENREKLSEIVSSIFIIKALFTVFTFLILGIILFTVPQASGYKALFILSMWSVVYSAIFPNWYFQGIEQMKYITHITLVSRLIFVGLIFVFIHSPADLLYVPIINGIGAIIAGLISLFIIFKLHGVSFRLQPVKSISYYIKDSIPLFISNVSIQLYVNTNKVVVGSFLGMTDVAYYDLAEKLTGILKLPQGMFSQAIYPKISKEKNFSFIKKTFKISAIMNIALFVTILIVGKYAIQLLGGDQMLPSHSILIILALTVPIIGVSNMLGINLLLPFGHNKEFSKIIVTSGIFYGVIISVIGVAFHFTLYNIALSTLVTEIFVSCYAYYHCKKLNLWK